MKPSERWYCFANQGSHKPAKRVDREDISNLLQHNTVIWIDIIQPNLEDMQWLKNAFAFHELALEDVLNNETRPKQELYDEVLFTVFGAISLQPDADELSTVNLNIFLTPKFIVTAHGEPLKSTRTVRHLVQTRPGLLDKGADHLYHHLLDGVIDRYFDVLDHIEEDIDEIEESLFEAKNQALQEPIFQAKRKVTTLKRSIGPKRTALRELVQGEFPQISPERQLHLRDVLDHVRRIDDMLESYRELLNSLMASYMTKISNQMNEVMKLMSIIATIMLPLSFLTGLFGMNFAKMPGLTWDFGFWTLLLVMVGLVGGMLWFFRERGIL